MKKGEVLARNSWYRCLNQKNTIRYLHLGGRSADQKNASLWEKGILMKMIERNITNRIQLNDHFNLSAFTVQMRFL